MSNDLQDLEQNVMEMLLAGENPVLEVLRLQYRSSQIKSRELTGCGFFTYFAVDQSVAVPIRAASLQLGDVDAVIPNLEHGAGFVLFVENGYLDVLEGYCYDESWPTSVSGFTLSYTGGSRDIKQLELKLG